MKVPSHAGGMLECALPEPADPDVFDDGAADVRLIEAVAPSVVPVWLWFPPPSVDVPALFNPTELTPFPALVAPVTAVEIECVCVPLFDVVKVCV